MSLLTINPTQEQSSHHIRIEMYFWTNKKSEFSELLNQICQKAFLHWWKINTAKFRNQVDGVREHLIAEINMVDQLLSSKYFLFDHVIFICRKTVFRLHFATQSAQKWLLTQTYSIETTISSTTLQSSNLSSLHNADGQKSRDRFR